MSGIHTPAVVPELDVKDLSSSLDFYVGILGFKVKIERPEEQFAYLVRDDVHLMLEQADGPGRRFRTAPLERPFGRGLNLQMRVADVADLYQKAILSGISVIVPLEERWYRQGSVEIGLRQFVVADPDGYLLRLAEEIGTRTVT